MAVTDEKMGEMLPTPVVLAGFMLQDVGGPILDERPRPDRLFADGRFLDFSDRSRAGQTGNFQNRQNNHSLSVTPDGERVRSGDDSLRRASTPRRFPATATAIAAHGEVQPPFDDRGCGRRDRSGKLPDIANDCIHGRQQRSVKALAFLPSPPTA